MADPSVGSVPAPISSRSTSEVSGAAVAASMMRRMRATCAEKVESDWTIDWSSPMSAITRSNHGTRAGSPPLSSHSTHSPARAISAAIPRVLRLTVLPPVFGPVITIAFTPGGTTMSIDTIALALGASPTLRQTMRGCFKPGSCSPSSRMSLNSTGTARMFALYLARAAARSTRRTAALSCRSSAATFGCATAFESCLSTSSTNLASCLPI
mmetsp:Transcript_44474/g.110686  ORF Transcript_44474/g.110686 Transcript_44474/m.110686 type:complete len:211 (+) Transcript_44474:1254-1886(+)